MKILKFLLSFFLIASSISNVNIHASNEENLPFSVNGGAVIRNEDGDNISNVEFDTIVKDTPSLLSSNESGIRYVATTEAKFDISKIDDGIMPLNEVGASGGKDVIANINIVFYWYPEEEKIKVTEIYGGWKAGSSFVLMERVVDAWTSFNDAPFPKYPTSNSFNYLTGWDKEYWYPPSLMSGAKANSSAWVTVPGMSGGEHEVFVFCEITFDDL